MPICLQNTSSILKAYLLKQRGQEYPQRLPPEAPQVISITSMAPINRNDWTSIATEVEHYQSPAGASCPRRDDLAPRASRRGPVRDRRKPPDSPHRRLLLEIPDPRNLTQELSAKLTSAFKRIQDRKVTHLVEEAFMKCHTALEVREAAKLPLGLPLELQQEDRRNLDDAVFELLGVQNPRRRKDLIDRLYREVASHFRSIRIVEVQKMEQRRHGGGKDDVSQTELALDAWNHVGGELHEPLPTWAEAENG